MKILLSTPPGKTTELWPPLGLLYIAGTLKENRNDEIEVVDAFCENLTNDQLLVRAKAKRPDVFGMNCTTHTFLDAVEVLGKIKEALPTTKIVMGGYHATFASERILREYPFVDYIIKGEAESAFPKLIDHIEKGTTPIDVPSISFLHNGELRSNEMQLIRDLDSLPFPDRTLLKNVDYGYTFQGVKLTSGKLTSIVTSRGCAYRCRYCSCSSFSLGEWRPRSPENVVDELEKVYSDGYEFITIVDDNFTQSAKRVEKICDLLRARKIRMQYSFEGRIENASYDMLKNMKGVGFDVVYFGIESACKHVLEYYHKKMDLERATRAIENAKKANMLVFTSYIFGAPVESEEDIRETIEFIRNNKPHGVQITILDCLIGTPIWGELMENEKTAKDAWKTNRRIFECLQDHLPKETLEKLVEEGYDTYLNGWKNMPGVISLLKLAFRNKTAMRFAMRNIINPDARRIVLNGIRNNGETRAQNAD